MFKKKKKKKERVEKNPDFGEGWGRLACIGH